MNFRAFIFDMDGLLFDTENLYLIHSKETEKEIGYSIPPELHTEAIGRTFPDVKRIFLDRLGQDFPMDHFMQRTNERVYEHVERYGMPVKPGAVELLQALKVRGIMTILASSSAYWMIEKNLAAAQLTSYFDLIVSGEEVEHGKPAPDIFLLAAERAGLEPYECVVLEDSNNGALAGCAAGMRTVMIPDVKPPTLEVAEKVFKIFPSLSSLLYEKWW
ncbi:MAG: HAD family hydrolase [Spirochaetota bacterium]